MYQGYYKEIEDIFKMTQGEVESSEDYVEWLQPLKIKIKIVGEKYLEYLPKF